MRKIFLGLLLLILGSTFSLANSITFTNTGGILNGSSAGLALVGSDLTGVFGFEHLGLLSGNLGTVNITTGSLISGNLQTGAVFNAGGTFTITGNGSDGLPNGTIFSGTFTSPVTFILVTLANGTHNYVLQGTLSGTFSTGQTLSGVDVQLSTNFGKGFFKSGSPDGGGSTVFVTSTVPEPSSMIYLGTGFLGLGAVVKRRLLRS